MDFSFTEEQTLLQESVSRFMQTTMVSMRASKMRNLKRASVQQTGKHLPSWVGWVCHLARRTAVLVVVPSRLS